MLDAGEGSWRDAQYLEGIWAQIVDRRHLDRLFPIAINIEGIIFYFVVITITIELFVMIWKYDSITN